MTIIENKHEVNTNNIIFECSSKITFKDVSSNLKKVIRNINKSYFKREYLFLSVDSFYEYKCKLNKEPHTEQYFIIFFKNNKEFIDMINNKYIDIEEINKKWIYFIYIIPNTFKKINEEERYKLFNHLYLDTATRCKINSDQDNISYSELLSKSGFTKLTEFSQLDILKNIELTEEEVSSLQFSGILTKDVADYYNDNYCVKKRGKFKKLINKVSTIF